MKTDKKDMQMIKAYMFIEATMNVNRAIKIQEGIVKNPYYIGSIPTHKASRNHRIDKIIYTNTKSDNIKGFAILDIGYHNDNKETIIENKPITIGMNNTDIALFKKLLTKHYPDLKEENIIFASIYRFVPLYRDEEIANFIPMK